VVFTQSLAVRDGTSADLRVILTATADGVDFEVHSVAGSVERVHARGAASWIPAGEESVTDLNAIRARCSQGEVTREIAQAAAPGLIQFGPRWDNLVRVCRGQGEALALLEDQYAGTDPYPWTIQPAVLDQAMGSSDGGREFLPFGYGRVVVRRPFPRQVWSHRRYGDAESADMFTADVTLYDESGRELLRAEDFTVRKVDPATFVQPPDAAAAGGEPVTDAIRPAAGAEAFRRLVDARIAPQVVISAKPIDEMIANSYRVDYQAVEQELAAPGNAPGNTGPAPAPPDGAGPPRSDREQIVAEILGDLLGVPAVASDADFLEIGGNSLIAVQLIAFLRKRFGVRLPMRRFFADPTPAGIAALIDELSSSAQPAPAASATPGAE
jgi:acyl carrier protein